ncbi:UNVERIFIED_CONTAM: hypothetical protein FKN15_046606 [Acipenser sinensis]
MSLREAIAEALERERVELGQQQCIDECMLETGDSPCSHPRATASEDNAALEQLQASPQAPGQTTGVAGARSDMSSASNTLAREFLTDVHQLCNAVAQRAEAQEEDEESHMVALGEYLVQGRGFLLLSTLDSIIDQATRQVTWERHEGNTGATQNNKD